MNPKRDNLPELATSAQAGVLAAQRALVVYLATIAADEDDPVPPLDAAAYYGRLAVAHGQTEDFARLVSVLMTRAALPGGDAAGSEAIAIIDEVANTGDEDAAASLLQIADKLPPGMAIRFFQGAKSFRLE